MKSKKSPENKAQPDSPTPFLKRSHRLKSVFDCQRILAKLANGVLMGRISGQDASRATYIVGVLLRAFELGTLEERIAKLEKAQENHVIG